MLVDLDKEVVFSRYNEMYGHGALLRKYCGVDDKRVRICGQVQHGWSLSIGVENQNLTPIYVWNDRSHEVAVRNGIKEDEITRIGAPYLYLPPIEPPMRIPRSLLAFPSHTTPGHPIADSYQFWEEYAEWIANVGVAYDFEQVTVSLHVNEYDDSSIVHQLNRRGLKVFCAGQVWSPWVTTIDYLSRVRMLILQHNVITANSVHSGIMYAAYEGKPIFIGGPTGKRIPKENTNEVYCHHTSDLEWIDRHFPQFVQTADYAKPHVEVGKRELGLNYKLSPADLWLTLNMGIDIS